MVSTGVIPRSDVRNILRVLTVKSILLSAETSFTSTLYCTMSSNEVCLMSTADNVLFCRHVLCFWAIFGLRMRNRNWALCYFLRVVVAMTSEKSRNTQTTPPTL